MVIADVPNVPFYLFHLLKNKLCLALLRAWHYPVLSLLRKAKAVVLKVVKHSNSLQRGVNTRQHSQPHAIEGKSPPRLTASQAPSRLQP